MGWYTIWRVLFLCIHLLCYDPTLGDNFKLSKEEELEIERQLKTLNKTPVKTIKSKFGDIYDCVDFYKQPAFDHSLLKNVTFDFQMKSSEANYESSEEATFEKSEADVLLTNQMLECPIGTVPIKRITKEYLIRERLASKLNSLANGVPCDAVVRTKQGPDRYYGARGFISIHNPHAVLRQYSAARISIRNGPEIIEAGYRVDETLYKDRQSRLYIRTDTDVGQAHCFNTFCPGFVITDHRIPLDLVLTNISEPGKVTYMLKVTIEKDKASGNWNLYLGYKNDLVGFWPSAIFGGLKDFSNYVDWGGSAFISGRFGGPGMGTGWYPVGEKGKDAYVRTMTKVNEGGEHIDADNVEEYHNHIYFKALDGGNVGGKDRHLMFFGGPGFI